ncbi:glycosyltransferase [Acaryochloris sp. IP29b_bin.137]|uniref:glycosyltransferase n=1 Tax=Acaryochloris sp. IP29b_bin.137 TaxID=2969217 RepID=UPI0026173B27|nr:glycosyltransferase [Acaryochloris sp. IP29b_bin.137]
MTTKPIFLAILLLGILRVLLPTQPPNWIKSLLVVLLIVVQSKYLVWRSTHTLSLQGPDALLCIGLFAYELLSILNSWTNNYLILQAPNRRAEADQYHQRGQRANKLSVDIFIPTYNEPTTMLERTLIGCKSIKYPKQQKHIWLLDDGQRPEMEALAKKWGCHYLTRPINEHAKAGNLNHALQQTNSEIVVVFDADFIPLNHFLERTIGFFQADNHVSMVVTPQKFYNPDPPQKNLGGRFIADEQTEFYQVIQPARDAVNAVVCSGSSVLYRRQHLEAIGGIPLNTIVEDYATGILMQARGYKTVYLNELLSVGCAANNINEYLKQRMRWAEGTLRMVISQHNPLWLSGLSMMQRFTYLSGTLYWLEEILKTLSFLSPILYLLLGWKSIDITLSEISTYTLYSYSLSIIVMSWMRGSVLLLIIYNLLQGFHVFKVVLKIFFYSQISEPFHVTSKQLDSYGIHFNVRSLSHILFLLILSILAIVFGMFHSSGGDLDWIYLIWAQANILLLATALIAGVSADHDRGHPRVFSGEACQITTPTGEVYEGKFLDISEAGCRLQTHLPVSLEISETVKVEVPHTSLRLMAEIRHQQRNNTIFGCMFKAVDPPTLWKLVNFTYCNSQNWQLPRLPTEWDTLRAIASGLYGLYPFRNLRSSCKAKR